MLWMPRFLLALLFAERAVAIDPNNSRYHQQLAMAVGLSARSASMFSAPGLISRFKSEMDKAVALDAANLDARRDLMGYYLNAPAPFGSVAQGKLQADEILKRDRAAGTHEGQSEHVRGDGGARVDAEEHQRRDGHE